MRRGHRHAPPLRVHPAVDQAGEEEARAGNLVGQVARHRGGVPMLLMGSGVGGRKERVWLWSVRRCGLLAR